MLIALCLVAWALCGVASFLYMTWYVEETVTLMELVIFGPWLGPMWLLVIALEVMDGVVVMRGKR